ncbi:hypothetical protein KQH82_02465 [bacterium]|nr:hypothetical protein [bacterium]
MKARNREIRDTEFPASLEYFERLMGKPHLKMLAKSRKGRTFDKFWDPFLKSIEKWRRDGSDLALVASDPRLIELSAYISYIREFESDWNDEESNKREFLHRLQKHDTAQGLLFEIRTGIHFRIQGIEAHWVANTTGKRVPDLWISCSRQDVAVECCCRKPSKKRLLNDEELLEDFIKSANDKLQSGANWTCPRMVAIMLPEPVTWSNQRLMLRLVERYEAWFREGRLRNVNVLFLMGHSLPKRVPSHPSKGPDHFETSEEVFMMRNPDPTYLLSEFLDQRLVQSSRPAVRLRARD